MSSPIRPQILQEIRAIFQELEKPLPPIEDSTLLLRDGLGLDSLDFATLVVRLDQRLKCDPFNNPNLERFPNTVGELVALYQQAS